MFPLFSFRKLKITPAAISPPRVSAKIPKLNHPDVIPEWYRANISELNTYAKPFAVAFFRHTKGLLYALFP